MKWFNRVTNKNYCFTHLKCQYIGLRCTINGSRGYVCKMNLSISYILNVRNTFETRVKVEKRGYAYKITM